MFLKGTSRGPLSVPGSLVGHHLLDRLCVSEDVVHHWQLMGCGLSACCRSHFLLCTQQLVSTVIYTAELWDRDPTQNVVCVCACECVCACTVRLSTHTPSLPSRRCWVWLIPDRKWSVSLHTHQQTGPGSVWWRRRWWSRRRRWKRWQEGSGVKVGGDCWLTAFSRKRVCCLFDQRSDLSSGLSSGMDKKAAWWRTTQKSVFFN